MTVATIPSRGRSAPLSMASTAWLPVSPSPLQRAENLALHGLGAENETGNRNCDQNQRPEREHRVIGKRRTEARILVLRPLADRLSERGEPRDHCLPSQIYSVAAAMRHRRKILTTERARSIGV